MDGKPLRMMPGDWGRSFKYWVMMSVEKKKKEDWIKCTDTYAHTQT